VFHADISITRTHHQRHDLVYLPASASAGKS
jgi:hypothetical protein